VTRYKNGQKSDFFYVFLRSAIVRGNISSYSVVAKPVVTIVVPFLPSGPPALPTTPRRYVLLTLHLLMLSIQTFKHRQGHLLTGFD